VMTATITSNSSSKWPHASRKNAACRDFFSWQKRRAKENTACDLGDGPHFLLGQAERRMRSGQPAGRQRYLLPKSKRVPRWCGVHSSRPVARLMTLARPALAASLAGTSARSSLGLRAHRQPDKPTLRLGTLSCLQHFFFVRLDQRFAIDPCLPSFSISRFRR
jgi:hypothetical protein